MLEDDFTYVVKKALVGNGLSPGEAADRAAIPETALTSFLRGKFCAQTARKIAPVLGLDAGALATHPGYEPQPLSHPGIKRLDLPFGSDRVNAWLLQQGETSLLFDLGHGPDDVFEMLGEEQPDCVFITHGHGDHVGGLARALSQGLTVFSADQLGTKWISAGEIIRHGTVEIEVMDLAGHADPALGFLVRGMATPVLVTGDALFAGSIGGCPNPHRYQTALANLRAALAQCSHETILLPGHGPATTLGEEIENNPFLARHAT
ncbi:MAG: MBL fold metallo-hydrolase [Verrucomicrobiota bacterium]